jgi:hypothetical protein
MWRLTQNGQTMICELHSDERAGAGWEVVLKLDDEWLFGRRCPEQWFARFVANGLKQDHVNRGWTEA